MLGWQDWEGRDAIKSYKVQSMRERMEKEEKDPLRKKYISSSCEENRNFGRSVFPHSHCKCFVFPHFAQKKNRKEQKEGMSSFGFVVGKGERGKGGGGTFF